MEKMIMPSITKGISHTRNAIAKYQLPMSIRNPSLTYFPSLVQGVPTEVKRKKKKRSKREAVTSDKEALREQIHPEKKNIDTDYKV